MDDNRPAIELALDGVVAFIDEVAQPRGVDVGPDRRSDEAGRVPERSIDALELALQLENRQTAAGAVAVLHARL